MNDLPHARPECAGEWAQEGARGAGLWRCTACGRAHASTPLNDRAADREYALGVLLRSQARQGRVKLPPPPRLPFIALPEPEGEE